MTLISRRIGDVSPVIPGFDGFDIPFKLRILARLSAYGKLSIGNGQAGSGEAPTAKSMVAITKGASGLVLPG